MIIGLDAWRPEDDDWFQALGVRWTKLACDEIDKGIVPQRYYEDVQAAAEAGLTVITDLRPSQELHRAIIGLLMRVGDEADAEATSWRNRLHDGVAEIVTAMRSYCRHWEFWGEYDCPYVGGFWPQKRVCYPHWLEVVGAAVREVDPGAEVWNGGYGVNFQPQFAEALVNIAPRSFDALNWHHYNISEYWPRADNGALLFDAPLEDCLAASGNAYRDMFVRVRQLMDSGGHQQPFVSSEWGMPVVSDEVANACGRIGLKSFVFRDGVYGLGDSKAALYLDAWLQVFEECGFRTLIYHRLWDGSPYGPDADGTFWGVYCGLLYRDGRPKAAMVDTLTRWIAKGNEHGES